MNLASCSTMRPEMFFAHEASSLAIGVYVVTVRDARLFLIARMKVAKVCSIGQAADALDCEGV